MSNSNPWTTNFPYSQDTGVNGSDQQPTLADDSVPGANDGDRVLVEHVHTVRNKLQSAMIFLDHAGYSPNLELIARAKTWEYPTMAKPTGTTLDAVGLWTFDNTGNTLLDRSGNGIDFSYPLGNTATKFHVKHKGLWGHGFDGNYWLEASNALLDLPLDLTLEFIVMNNLTINRPATLLSYNAGGSLGVDNSTYYDVACYQGVAGLTADYTKTSALTISHSAAAAFPNNWVYWTPPSVFNPGEWIHLIISRKSDGKEYSIYQQGLWVGNTQLAEAPFTSVDSRVLYLGGTSLLRFLGVVAALKITPEYFDVTAAQSAFDLVCHE